MPQRWQRREKLCMQVEPVKWSQQKARIVLNEAIEGAVGDDLLQAAAEAVSNGYDGSLSRWAPSRILPFLSVLVRLARYMTCDLLVRFLSRRSVCEC